MGVSHDQLQIEKREKEKTAQQAHRAKAAQNHVEAAKQKTQQQKDELDANVEKHRIERQVDIEKEKPAQQAQKTKAAKAQAEVKKLSIERLDQLEKEWYPVRLEIVREQTNYTDGPNSV